MRGYPSRGSVASFWLVSQPRFHTYIVHREIQGYIVFNNPFISSLKECAKDLPLSSYLSESARCKHSAFRFRGMRHDGHAKPLLCLPPSLIRNSVTFYTAVSATVQDIQSILLGPFLQINHPCAPSSRTNIPSVRFYSSLPFILELNS